MKFYICSSDQNIAIKLANAISKTGGTSIISEQFSDVPESLVSDILNNADQDAVSIIVCNNPVKLTLAANKTGYFNAVSCSTQNDMATALEEGANFIAIQDDSESVSSITSAFSNYNTAGSSNAKKLINKPKPQIQPSQQKGRFMDMRPKQQSRDNANNAKRAADEDNTPSQPLWSKDKGVKKNLKSLFGLE